jgi:hypothetical protein
MDIVHQPRFLQNTLIVCTLYDHSHAASPYNTVHIILYCRISMCVLHTTVVRLHFHMKLYISHDFNNIRLLCVHHMTVIRLHFHIILYI